VSEGDHIAEIYSAKARAELARADALLPGSEAVAGKGDPFARVVLVKGVPGPEDERAGTAMAGPDGEAAAKALGALGLDSGGVFCTCSRPVDGGDPDAVIERLAWIVEAVDPDVVLALDAEAAHDLARAVGVEELRFGEPSRRHGRAVLAVEGLEASLDDEARKARVWGQLKRVVDADRRGSRFLR
jgi:uracil-DNA glycosylase